MLDLYAHNRMAYESAVRLLAETGKAAIVNPTGTGKSYIAFQLVADHPTETILWLSPSDYIFKTQCESLHRQAPEVSLANVHFYTYAKLLRLTDADRAAIAAQQPAYIILDEYHRAGAQEWSAALQRLLAVCPDAKLLGLSATNIRYLDNQRNMADELFDGHVASEMTLGEAIVRGILPAPKYVTTVFRYDKDLARYEQRVARQRAAYQHPESEHSRLTPERIQLLNQIGMQWQRPGAWDRRYALAQDYLRDHGNLQIPAKYKAGDGILLGNWLYRQRRIYEGKAPGKLNPTQREKLRVLFAQNRELGA